VTNPASLPTMLKVRFPRATSLPRPTLPSVPRPSLPRPSWAMIGIASVDAYRHESYRRQHQGVAMAKALREIDERFVGLDFTTDASHSILVDRVNSWVDATRSVKTALAALDARVETIDDDVETANGEIRILDARVETIANDVVDTEGNVQDLDDRIDGQEYRIDDHDDKVEAVEDLVNDAASCNARFEELTNDVEELTKITLDAAVNSKSMAVAIDDMVDTETVTSVVDLVEVLTNDAAVNSKAIDDVSETVASVQAVLSALVTNVQHDRNTAAATTERLDVATEKRLDVHEEAIAELALPDDSRIVTIEKRLDALDEGRANCAIVQGRLLDSADMARSERAALANKVSATLEEQHDRMGTLAEAALIQADKIAVLETHHGDHCEALDSLDGELDAAAETVVTILREIAALRAALRASE